EVEPLLHEVQPLQRVGGRDLGFDRTEALLQGFGAALAAPLGLVRLESFEVATNRPALLAAGGQRCLVLVTHGGSLASCLRHAAIIETNSRVRITWCHDALDQGIVAPWAADMMYRARPWGVDGVAYARGVTAEQAIHRALGLTDDEAASIERILGREPNHLELAMYAVMWSEHCSYKSSRLHLRRLPSEGPGVLVGPGEN